MDYRPENYAQDYQIAGYVYRTYFRKSYPQFEDDLIQIAVIKLWEFRKNPKSYYTKTGANKTALNAMIDFLRKENKYLDDVSMSEELEEDLLLVDTLPIERDTSYEKEVRYLYLKRIIDDQIFGLNHKQRKIIGMYLNRRSYQEIADCVGIAKQNVGVCIKSFREKLAKKLGLDIERWKRE